MQMNIMIKKIKITKQKKYLRAKII
ncbi:hypothetical protein PFFCH_05552 [Plasmodium falciparum FCH/4]|uniref:Uncharacterized protein n=1 Tax=Plasmodium falciparum FCH/4 TaxID=1036724 RepID=A0A024VET6_PLAFA|nr:hypothetical protein PFFCH_05552 [Plasmodium falciparum FCH/4]